MDPQVEEHLKAWLEARVPEKERLVTERLLRDLLTDHPFLLTRNYSWPELFAMAERNQALGIRTKTPSLLRQVRQGSKG